MALTVTPISGGISSTPASAVATNGTITFTYPSGYNASSFVAGGATMWSEGLETLFTEGASNFSVSYGASSATVTYLGSTSIPAGTRVVFQPSYAPVVGVQLLPIHLNLADLANGDVLTNYTPGFAFKVLSVDFQVQKAVTTAAKAATLNLEIGTTNLTGGVVALTSANCTPAGAQVAGTAVTAANTGTATDTLSIEASSVTAFVEGTGVLLIKLQNLDTYNEVAAR
jgi:hypothetical protein